MAAKGGKELFDYLPPQPGFTPCWTCGGLLVREHGAYVTPCGQPHVCQEKEKKADE
jgi:hypothetical protein